MVWRYARGVTVPERTMDIIDIGLTLGFFALSWTLIKLCERV